LVDTSILRIPAVKTTLESMCGLFKLEVSSNTGEKR